MSFFGKTKGTELEKTIGQLAAGEAMGGMMYYALSRAAKEMGLDGVAEEFLAPGAPGDEPRRFLRDAQRTLSGRRRRVLETGSRAFEGGV